MVNQALLTPAFVEQTVRSFRLLFLFQWCPWSRCCKSAVPKAPYGIHLNFQIPGVQQLRFYVFGCCAAVYAHCSSVLVGKDLDENLYSTEIKGNFASLEPRLHLKLELARSRL